MELPREDTVKTFFPPEKKSEARGGKKELEALKKKGGRQPRIEGMSSLRQVHQSFSWETVSIS